MSAPSHDPDQVAQRLELAVAIAAEAGRETLKYFQNSDLQVDRKADDSPVTAADRAAEQLLRARISEAFPQDGILGEEFGASPGGSPYRWILDPIDGTKSFIHGVPLYTTLVAVTHTHGAGGQEETPVAGVIHAPAAGETVYASVGGRCWHVRGEAPPREARVSDKEGLASALILTSEVATFSTGRDSDALDVYLELQRQARLARTWGDAYGYLMVATGRAEVMIDPEMSLWDAAALKPVIEAAGGSFTDWQGRPTVHSGDAVATNGRLTGEVLSLTRGR